MWIIPSSIGLLAAASGMALLAKSKKEELGKSFRWMSYVIIVFGFLGFACALSHGICGMWCHHGHGSEMQCHGMGGMQCMPCPPSACGGMGMQGDCHGMDMKGCSEKMGSHEGKCCGMGGGEKCIRMEKEIHCEGHGESEENEEHHEHHKMDSVVIKK